MMCHIVIVMETVMFLVETLDVMVITNVLVVGIV